MVTFRQLVERTGRVAESDRMRATGVKVVFGIGISRNLAVFIPHLSTEFVDVDQLQDLSHRAYPPLTLPAFT